MSRPGYENPHYKPHRDLGEASKTDAEFATLQTTVTDYLQHADREGQATVTTAELRALDSDFDDDRLWNQIAFALDLTPTAVPD